MKKIVLLALFATISHQVFSQLSGFGFRPAMSLSYYKLSKEINDNYDIALRPGASMAAFIEFNLGNRFTVQPELAFTQRGANLVNESSIYWDGQDFGYSNDLIVTQHKQKEALNYIDIPIMFEKNFGGGSWGGYVAAGPAMSFALKGRGREEITLEPARPDLENEARDTERFDYDIEMGSGRNDFYKALDMSLNAGAGLLYIMERGEIGIDLRYTHGLRYLNQEGLKNRNFLIGVSYMHYIGQ
jgi:Outer membrane protein beta-barrel domain